MTGGKGGKGERVEREIVVKKEEVKVDKMIKKGKMKLKVRILEVKK